MDTQYSTHTVGTTDNSVGVPVPPRATTPILDNEILDNETVLELDYALIAELQAWSETITRTIAPGCYRS